MKRDDAPLNDDDDARRWQVVKAALAQALELPTGARPALIAEWRARDPALADELSSLVSAHEQSRPHLMGLAPGVVNELVRAHADALRMGQRLGAYRLVSRLGSGGMGDVYLGERADGTFQMQVAVKVLREGLVDEAAIQRFERERQILASLDHVNLAKLFDGGVTEEGLPYFVMERVEGVPLTDYCVQRGLDVKARVHLLRAVCQVVHYVHQRGVVHRDLKPRNILVTDDGTVKLLDFGIAKLMDRHGGHSGNTAPLDDTVTAQRPMTPLYSSPEQVRGQPISPASDVYSLGVVMCQVLAGHAPYALDTTTAPPFELARAICDDEPMALSQTAAKHPSGVPARLLRGDLDAVVAKALRKDPAARYASAEQMADDLFRHLEQLPVGARRGARGYRLGRWLVRHRAVAAGAIFANVALLVGLGVALDQAHEARLQREQAAQASAKVRTLANVAMFEFHDAVAKLPGSIDARKLLVDKAQAYLTALEGDARNDHRLGMELAASFRKLGDIQGRPNWANLGDFDGALVSYDRSLALLQGLDEHVPPTDLTTFTLERVLTLGRKASLLSYTGRRPAAQATSEEALRALDGLAEREPHNVLAMVTRANIHGVFSWVLHEGGDITGFLAQATAGEAQLQQALALEPDDFNASFSLASAYARRGVYYLERDRSEESARLALEPLEKWQALAERLHAAAPDNPNVGGALSESRSYLGKAYERLKDPARALDVLRRSTDELTHRVQLNPRDEHLSFVLMNARVMMASAMLGLHDATGAQDQARQALALADDWPEATRRSTIHLHSRAGAHFMAGRAAESANHGRPSRTACDQWRTARDLLKAISEPLPASSEGELSREDVERALGRCGA